MMMAIWSVSQSMDGIAPFIIHVFIRVAHVAHGLSIRWGGVGVVGYMGWACVGPSVSGVLKGSSRSRASGRHWAGSPDEDRGRGDVMG